MQNLAVTLIQCKLAWEQPEDNRRQFGDIIDDLDSPTDLIVLPEMFTTGFSMNALANSEEPGGATEQWLLQVARQQDCAVTGSIAVRDGKCVYNRMLFATPAGIEHYDKRHLFRLAGEQNHYAPGETLVTFELNGWRVCPMVCYDLRFPAWSRNRDSYDLLLYVANWPERRHHAWETLLRARAIENLSYVAGVNRTGKDGNDIPYKGGSSIIDYLGETLVDLGNRTGTATTVLDLDQLGAFRDRFAFHKDADNFTLT